MSLGFDQVKWTFSSKGKYLLVEHPRALRQIYHPWDISQDGDFASLSAKVTVPADWQGPIFLSLYANDTYVSEGWKEVSPKWTFNFATCHNFVGHRFKQVLIDGRVVWEQDIGDSEDFGYFSADVSQRVAPGGTFTLTLRVLDKVGSATKLPGDEFHLGVLSWEGLGDPNAEKKLYTRVFWGDVALSAGAPVPWEGNPSRRDVQLYPISLKAAEPVTMAEGHLTLDCPNGLPEDGYPVTWGIPFGQGELFHKEHVRLTDFIGNPVPLQTTVQHKWPDGSIHWLLLDFLASGKSANQTCTITYGTQISPTPAEAGLTVHQTEGAITVDTGGLRFMVNKGSRRLVENVTLAGEEAPLGKEMTGEVVARDGWVHTRFLAVNEEIAVETAGPERVTIRCAGRLKDGNKVFGRFTCRIHAYRGKPYVRIFFRIFNEVDVPAQLVEEFLLRLRTPLVDGEAALGDQKLATASAETGRLLVRQRRHDAYEIFEGNDAQRTNGVHWQGPITLQTPAHGISGQVRHFAQQYPKRMSAGEGGQVVFDLFTRTVEYEQYVMTRGEAKRHELLLYFHKGTANQPQIQATFQTFESPPILISPQWYAEHQAFGRGAALTPETFPELHKWMVERYTPPLVCTVPNGLRNWPDSYSDSIYDAYRGTWMNMYQERDYGAYILALLAGRRACFDYAEAYQRHFMDIDICHYHSDPAYIGASYGIAAYHTGYEPYALNAPLAGLYILHYLTGDPDAREAAIGIADWLHATKMGVGGGSGRGVGWPLRSSTIAYENTYDEKYLQASKRLAEFALETLKPRRSFFSETPATWQYRGGIPGMNAILSAGLMHYWRATGDERVGRACANIAYNMAYSWMSPTEPGLILNGDPLQQVYLVGYAMQDIMPLFWGYELTGDKAFLEKGGQMMQESILDERHKGRAFSLIRYWEMQDILYYYGLYKEQRSKN
ncbi:MAG: hypothetical protein HY298_17460 [Verrucomicrobia bacterium]|nr:hypothetical protein [Verrucomicrobiota bacterium]